jgi:hypothetical protein
MVSCKLLLVRWVNKAGLDCRIFVDPLHAANRVIVGLSVVKRF